MQQHGQTIFLIEQLQPSWLGTHTHRIAYALGSRVAAGLIFAMIGGLGNLAKLMFGTNLNMELSNALQVGVIDLLTCWMVFGLTGGIIDACRFDQRTPWTRLEPLPRYARISIFLMAYWLVGSLFFCLLFDVWIGFVLGIIAGVVWTWRGHYRTITTDIQCLESLTWSWLSAGKGGFYGFVLGSDSPCRPSFSI